MLKSHPTKFHIDIKLDAFGIYTIDCFTGHTPFGFRTDNEITFLEVLRNHIKACHYEEAIDSVHPVQHADAGHGGVPNGGGEPTIPLPVDGVRDFRCCEGIRGIHYGVPALDEASAQGEKGEKGTR